MKQISMKKCFVILTASLSSLLLLQGCASTEELYAQYDELACRVALEQSPGGDTLVRELVSDETMTWEPVIRFALQADELSMASKERLEQDASVLVRYPELRVSVRGFTDASGTTAFNAALAEKRVKSVVAYLRDNGVHPSRMDEVPLGEGLPLLSGGPDGKVPDNRRVELFLLDINGNPISYRVGNPDER